MQWVPELCIIITLNYHSCCCLIYVYFQKFWYIHSKRCLDYCTYLYSGFSWVFQRFIAKLSYRILLIIETKMWMFYCLFVWFFCFPTQILHCVWTKVAVDVELPRMVVSFTHSGSCKSEQLKGPITAGFLAIIKNCWKATSSCLGTKSA